jgi:hypothetical protein
LHGNRPNDHKIYQHLSLLDTQKITQIDIFGLKKYHLATLLDSWHASAPDNRIKRWKKAAEAVEANFGSQFDYFPVSF